VWFFFFFFFALSHELYSQGVIQPEVPLYEDVVLMRVLQIIHCCYVRAFQKLGIG